MNFSVVDVDPFQQGSSILSSLLIMGLRDGNKNVQCDTFSYLCSPPSSWAPSHDSVRWTFEFINLDDVSRGFLHVQVGEWRESMFHTFRLIFAPSSSWPVEVTLSTPLRFSTHSTLRGTCMTWILVSLHVFCALKWKVKLFMKKAEFDELAI